MRIEAHDKLGKPINQEITRVVVYDDFDNPIVVSVKYGQGTILVTRVGDDDFETVIKALGIDKVVIVKDVPIIDQNAAKRITLG